MTKKLQTKSFFRIVFGSHCWLSFFKKFLSAFVKNIFYWLTLTPKNSHSESHILLKKTLIITIKDDDSKQNPIHYIKKATQITKECVPIPNLPKLSAPPSENKKKKLIKFANKNQIIKKFMENEVSSA